MRVSQRQSLEEGASRSHSLGSNALPGLSESGMSNVEASRIGEMSNRIMQPCTVFLPASLSAAIGSKQHGISNGPQGPCHEAANLPLRILQLNP